MPTTPIPAVFDLPSDERLQQAYKKFYADNLPKRGSPSDRIHFVKICVEGDLQLMTTDIDKKNIAGKCCRLNLTSDTEYNRMKFFKLCQQTKIPKSLFDTPMLEANLAKQTEYFQHAVDEDGNFSWRRFMLNASAPTSAGVCAARTF